MEKYEISVGAVIRYKEWLFSHPDPNTKRFYAGGVELSVKEVVDEIIKRSDLGKTIHQMMIDTGKFDKIAADSVSIK